jgi:hypothetical protein
VYFASAAGAVSEQACTGGQVCGWDAASKWYGCVAHIGTDPSGAYPLLCGGTPVAGACTTVTAPPAPDPYAGGIKPTTCEETHGSTGCCGPGNRAYFIGDDGQVKESVCTGGNVCGWREDKGWYGCTNGLDADPSGTYPLLCGGAAVAGACSAGGTGASGGGGSSSTPPPASGGLGSTCSAAWECNSGLSCIGGYCLSGSSGAGAGSGSSCQSPGGYGGLGCTGQFVLGCQQIGCGCCESGGIGQCC